MAAGVAALLFTGARDTDDALKTYEIEFDNGFGLVEGGDLKIGGVKAGKTTGFELTDTRPYRVVATAEVSEEGFDSLREDAECDVRQQSLIGEYFVDCDLGSADAKPLPDGGRVPVENTTSTIPPDLISNIQRRPYRERFRLILSELGTGLAGRPEDLNEVIRRAHPGLRETSETFRILARQNRIIRDFITNADRVSQAVEPNKEDVARWAEEAADTASIQASRSEELARYWNRLPTFLRELEPTMAQLGRTADRQIPTLRRLREAAPELTDFFTEIEPFARSLARLDRRAGRRGRDRPRGAARVQGGDRGAERAVGERAQARQAAAPGPPDDRRPRPLHDARPGGPGRRAAGAGQDGVDEGRAGLHRHGGALELHLLPDARHQRARRPGPPAAHHRVHRRRLRSLLGQAHRGPDQAVRLLARALPARRDQPDPTRDGTAAAALRDRERPQTRAERKRPRGPGDFAAPPDPGKPDPSKPRIVLPDQIQELIDRLDGSLPPLETPRLPGLGDGASPREMEQLLDFLLAP